MKETFLDRVVQQARGRPPSPFRLDLSVSPGNLREFELWRDGMTPLFAMDAPDAERRSSFEVQATSYQFSDVAIISGCSSAAVFQRTAKKVATSPLDNISLLVYSEGGCALDACGRSVEVHPGDIGFIDLSRPVALRAPDYESLTLILPRDTLRPYVADIDRLHGQVLRKSSPLNAMLVSHLRTLFAESSALGAADASAAAHGAAALVAAFAGASSRGRDLITRSSAAAILVTYRQFVEENLADPDLGPETLCRQFGVSRATLFRIFEPTGGVRCYILQRRLARAHRLVNDPAFARHRIDAIAYRCGFKSHSAFSRAFHQTFAMSPTEMRTASQRAGSQPDLGGGEQRFGTMGRWLLGLGDSYDQTVS